MLRYTRDSAPKMPILSAPSNRTRGICRGLVAELPSSTPVINKLAALWFSGGFSAARSRRSGISKMALIVFGLLM